MRSTTKKIRLAFLPLPMSTSTTTETLAKAETVAIIAAVDAAHKATAVAVAAERCQSPSIGCARAAVTWFGPVEWSVVVGHQNPDTPSRSAPMGSFPRARKYQANRALPSSLDRPTMVVEGISSVTATTVDTATVTGSVPIVETSASPLEPSVASATLLDHLRINSCLSPAPLRL